jgi:hypothetical protein
VATGNGTAASYRWSASLAVVGLGLVAFGLCVPGPSLAPAAANNVRVAIWESPLTVLCIGLTFSGRSWWRSGEFPKETILLSLVSAGIALIVVTGGDFRVDVCNTGDNLPGFLLDHAVGDYCKTGWIGLNLIATYSLTQWAAGIISGVVAGVGLLLVLPRRREV